LLNRVGIFYLTTYSKKNIRKLIRKPSILTLFCVWLTCLAHAQLPLADFTAATVSGCSPLVVNFSDASTGNPTSWFWDFGNGATSTLKNPSTTYFIPGPYTIILTVTNASGFHTTTKQQFVRVYDKPIVLLTGNDSLGCYPFPVSFTDLSIPSIGTTNTSWIWDFGDGGQSTSQSPLNTYLNSGNYTVSLKVTNDKGCFNTFTKPAYIRINGGVKADFNFSYPAVCRTPVTVSFSNLSTGPGILSYQWLFGDGGNSTLPSPPHTYTAPGTYTVTLITRSSSGCVDTVRMNNVFDFKDIITSFTAPDSVCVDEAVNILNTSSATAVNTSWSFGNGNTSTSANGSTSYAIPGTYTIRLLQSYGNCSDSTSKTIKVRPRPVAGFNVDKPGFCQVPATVNFSNTSSGGVSYQWLFGDGGSSNAQNPSHTYTSFGNYEAILVVTNSIGCTDSSKRTISVGKPVISLNSLPGEGCIPYGVNFSASISSPEPVVSYLWNFGNGVTSTATNPSYTYTTQGTYTVSLAVTTVSGCTETYSMPAAVRVGTKPNVNFAVTPREVCAFRPVVFTNQTTGGGTEYLWSFGDGGNSTLSNPTHEYGDTGIFNVTLYVKNNGCRDSLKIDSIVKIKPPIAKFVESNTCADKLNVTFTNHSIGAITWHWNFGDGNTSTQQNTVHRYAAYGIYTVTLTVTNDTCSHQMVRTIRIENSAPDFKANVTSACKGSTINFAADTTNMAQIVSYDWDFGYGGASGNGRTVSTIYPRAGIYTVSLTTTDLAGCKSTTTKPQYIRITGPTAGFIATNNNGCRNLTATFTDASQADGSNIVSWQWNFGDGTIVTNNSAASIQHLYSQPGSFPVSLILSDAGGCVDTITKPAFVNVSNIKADFISADTVSCPGATIRFTNQSSASSAFVSHWQFGDGDTSTQNNPVTTYNSDGLYTVKLKIADALGCTDSLTRLNYVSIKSPVAKYTVSDSISACTPFQVRFTNASTYYTGFSWDLGGGTSSLANPIQYYNQPGTYQTQLIVTSPGGCKDTATQTITVNDVRNASINYLPLNGCKPLTVDVNSIAPKNMSYIWDFGDGTILTSNDTSTQHVYNFFGDFVPKLILTDASGCVIPVTGPDTIRIKGATAKFAVDKKLLCDSGLVRFLDSTTFNNPIISYEWNFGDGTTSTQPTVTHYYNQPGLYPVSVNVLTQNNCVDTFRMSVPVKVVQSPDIRIAGDSVICVGEDMTHLGEFNRIDTSSTRWAWSFPNGKTADVRLPQKQVYTLAGNFVVRTTVINSSGCIDTASKNIRVNPLPRVELPALLTTRTGTPIKIPAEYFGGPVSYNWTHPESLDCYTCPEPIASPKFDTKYEVNFVDANGCRNRGEIKIVVFCNNDNVFVPNTFSPNGDGSNDIFYVRGKGLNRVKTLRILNRWGQVVYEKFDFGVNDASAGWDGKFRGAKPVPDVYVYQMEVWCDNSTVVRFDGNVALIQ
jgi:gliding motility-associated-like protein